MHTLFAKNSKCNSVNFSLINFSVCYSLCLHTERSVKDPRIDRAVGVCKRIVNFFSHSWKRQHALENAQKEMGLPQHKLTTESPTRWGSRYKMITRLLEQEKAITQVLAADRATRHLVPSWQDIDVSEKQGYHSVLLYLLTSFL